jgi:undecaprenyl-diphosphatase
MEGMVRHLIDSCNGYSFTSNHATNHFAIGIFIAFYMARFFKGSWALAISWAAAISFSQVYIGIHYPLDVIVGGLLGSLFGIAFARYTSRFVNSF